MPSLLPIFLDLHDRPVLLVGGGLVALEKLHKLVATGARLTAVATVFHPDTLALLTAYGAAIHHRGVIAADMVGQSVVISAVNDPATHRAVALLAHREGVLVNTVDAPASADFFFGAQVERGPLQIAISTHGLFPGVARAIRQWLEEFLPDEISPEFEDLVRLRQSVKAHIPDPVLRMRALKGQLQQWLQQEAHS